MMLLKKRRKKSLKLKSHRQPRPSQSRDEEYREEL
jgi:hypothetical protein